MHFNPGRKGQVGIAGIGQPCHESAGARVERRTGSSMMPLRAAGAMLIGLATAGCSPPSTHRPRPWASLRHPHHGRFRTDTISGAHTCDVTAGQSEHSHGECVHV
jgi:hypothetical protein